MIDPTYPWGNGYPALGQFSVSNSILLVRAQRTPVALKGQLPINPVLGTEFTWVSAAMTTFESLRIGPPCYIETRVKLPRGKGLWPAFWHIVPYTTYNHLEIDVMEQYQINRPDYNRLIRSQPTPVLLQNAKVNLIFDLAVGGGAPGAPDGTTPSPAYLKIAWVKIWAANTNYLWTNGI